MARLTLLALLAAVGCGGDPEGPLEPAPTVEPREALGAARASWREGALEDAARAAERVLARRPEDADALEILGRARLAQGRHADAARALARALAADPGRSRLHFPRAAAHEGAGELAPAMASYRASIAAERWPVRARIALARLSFDALGASPEAEALAPIEDLLDLAEIMLDADEGAQRGVDRERGRIEQARSRRMFDGLGLSGGHGGSVGEGVIGLGNLGTIGHAPELPLREPPSILRVLVAGARGRERAPTQRAVRIGLESELWRCRSEGERALTGRLRVTVALDEAGAVARVDAPDDRTTDPTFWRCAEPHVRAWRAPPGEPAEVDLVFVLVPAGPSI